MIEPRAALRIAAFVTLGLAPSIAALVVAPGRGAALAASGSVVMAATFSAWAWRLASEGSRLTGLAVSLRNDVTALEEKVASQNRELRDVRTSDEVTGLLNRSAFLRRLDEAIARDARLGKPLAFLLIDIEDFRALNAEQGRIGGDKVLKQVAAAIQGATRGTDCVGRLGGDEFGVALSECEDPRPAVNRLFVALGAGDGATVRVSVGAVTIENPAGGVDMSELFRLAEGALASVRGTGGSLCARRTLRGETDSAAATA
ncbi:MAG TPA: GGDEF domain-containing protein [Candidatus Polarisedimenticolaceae bacterium]|nr:GGDEF domain-containing protein [Candidatus Polarisedimenticolaceae bacterium]